MPRKPSHKSSRHPFILIIASVAVATPVLLLSVLWTLTSFSMGHVPSEVIAQLGEDNNDSGAGSNSGPSGSNSSRSRSSKSSSGLLPASVFSRSSSSKVSAGSSFSVFLSSSRSSAKDEHEDNNHERSDDDSPFDHLSSLSSLQPVAPIKRVSSSGNPSTTRSTEMGCFNVHGQWTLSPYECATSAQQAELLGIPTGDERVSEEEFQRVAAELFRDANRAHGEEEVRGVKELIALTMQRIDEVLAQPRSMLLVEAALETRNWLEEQYQTVTPENADIVAVEVPRRLRVMESHTLFAHIDAVGDMVWSTFHTFNQEEVVLPLEDLFSFQSALEAVDDPACRSEGSSCAAITLFLETVQQVHAAMENAAVTQGKPQLLDLLQ